MTKTISREDCIAWLERPSAVMIGAGGKMTDAIIAYLRPPPADDGVIGDVTKLICELQEAVRNSWGEPYRDAALIEVRAADLRTVIALARQAGATGEHPVSVAELVAAANNLRAMIRATGKEDMNWSRQLWAADKRLAAAVAKLAEPTDD